MNKLTFKTLSDGVALALSKAFPKANVFCNKTLQQVSPGDFNVIPVSILQTEKLLTHAKYQVLFDVIYFPDEGNECDDCLKVASSLPTILETIETPEKAKVHCESNVALNIVDEVLHCSVTYRYTVSEKRVPARVDENGKPVVDLDGDPLPDEEAEKERNAEKMYILENSDEGVTL